MSGLSQVCRVYMWRATADTIADIDRILDRYLVSLFLYVWTIITSCELDLTYLWLWFICKPIPLIYKVCSQVNPNCCPNIYHSVQTVVSSQLNWIFNLDLLHTIGPTTHHWTYYTPATGRFYWGVRKHRIQDCTLDCKETKQYKLSV